MRKRIRSLPPWAEFGLVLIVAQGWFVYVSLRHLLSVRRVVVETDVGIWLLAAHEAVVFLLLGWFLRLRGWTLQHIGLIPSWRDTAIGICMAALVYFVVQAISFGYNFAMPGVIREMLTIHLVHRGFTPSSAAVLVLMNPFFEEVFTSGYLITALKQRFSPGVAVGASIFLRVLYHLYQGWSSVLHTVPLGLIFGLWYVRTNRLWPLVIAHMALNAFAMAHYVQF